MCHYAAATKHIETLDMTRSITTAIIQHECGNNPKANLNVIVDAIRDAASQNAQLIVLQELHNTLYFCQNENSNHFNLAETIPGPTSTLLSTLAKELGLVIVGSIFEKRTAGLYHNTAIVIESDGRLLGRYRKMHIPDDPGYYEKYYFAPGDLGFEPVVTSVGILGIMVCWDQWFPEAARLMALAGAELLIYPTAIGWDKADTEDEQQRQKDAWTTIQRSHAIANGIPVVSCNRTGHESDPSGQSEGITFWGSSFVAGPQGEIISIAPENKAWTNVTPIDLGRTETVRRSWPFLRDRRIDAYHDIILRYRDK